MADPTEDKLKARHISHLSVQDHIGLAEASVMFLLLDYINSVRQQPVTTPVLTADTLADEAYEMTKRIVRRLRIEAAGGA